MVHRRPPAASRIDRTWLRSAPFLFGLLVVVLIACQSTSDEEKPTVSGSSRGSGGVPMEQRPVLDRYWNLFLRDDPSWPGAREEWLALGDPARAALVQSLIRDLIVGTSRMQPDRVDRASVELVRLGVLAVPDLIETGRRGDGILRQQVAEILVFIGRPAVDAVVGSLETRKDGPFRRHEIEVLGKIGDIRAYPVVRTSLFEDEDWADRAAAATALAGLADSRAVADLERVLRTEKDEYVRERAALALGNFQDARSIVALIEAMEAEDRRGPSEGRGVVRACTRSLRRITGEDLAQSAAVWRTWWNRNGREWQASLEEDGGD